MFWSILAYIKSKWKQVEKHKNTRNGQTDNVNCIADVHWLKNRKEKEHGINRNSFLNEH